MSKVNNVKSFLDKIEKLESKNNVFFRGHSDKDYVLEPGIYRKDKIKNKSLVEFEDKIYREIISKAPQDFIGKNTLESLALMQHYEAPTRVLDLTENALVALYFACVGNTNLDGEVIVFDIPDESTCHYDSDRVTILANLAKCGKEFIYNIGSTKAHEGRIEILNAEKVQLKSDEFDDHTIDILKFLDQNTEMIGEEYINNSYNRYFEDVLNLSLDKYETSNGKLSKINLKHFRNFYIDTVQKHYRNLISKEIKILNEIYFGKLLHNIKEDKSYFDAVINPNDISKVFAVKPKLNNPRIIKQSGAFLIFGIQEENFLGSQYLKPIAILNEKWILRGNKSERIIVDKKAKSKIVKELKILGFDESTLFPEVDKVSHFVRNNFLDRLKA
jgi:hypothetical protein